MLLKIGENTYPLVRPERLTLLDLLMLGQETKAMGRPLSMKVLQAMQRDIAAEAEKHEAQDDKDKAREEHPDSPWLLAVMIWGSQRAGGNKVTFEEAISFPLEDLDFVPEAGDEPEEVADPTPALPASGQGDELRVSPKQKKTSKPRSTGA